MHARVCKKVSSRCAGKVGSSRGQRGVLLASVFKLCLFLEHGATEQEGSVARMRCVLNIWWCRIVDKAAPRLSVAWCYMRRGPCSRAIRVGVLISRLG